MSDSSGFAILNTELDGLPIIANIDLSIQGFKGRLDFPWFLSLETSFEDSDIRGQPKKAEAKQLNAWEDSIESLIGSKTAYIFVGRVTWNGKRELLYYVATPENVVLILQKRIRETTSRAFAFRCELDDAWENIAPYLEQL